MTRNSFLLGLFVFPMAAFSQGSQRANDCFFSVDFEGGIPLTWDVGAFVERQTPDGDPLGEFVPAWTVGDAAQANANGFFPVPNFPIGNHFLMANDDAAPCNCDMSDIAVTTSAIDLSGRTGVGLEFMYYNSDYVSAGDAVAMASSDGLLWDTVRVMSPSSDWVHAAVDLSAYDGSVTLFLRFRWSDGGAWASGFALDYICLRERLPVDVSVLDVRTHDYGVSPFNTLDRTLRYRMLPLEQAGPLTASVRLINRGTETATGVAASLTISQNGNEVYNLTDEPLGDLEPGATGEFAIGTDWTATEFGEVEVSITVVAGAGDDDPSDNAGIASMYMTGPGWNDGYGAMARDEGQPDGTLGGSLGFIAANRMEIINSGSTARGISALIGGGSTVGEYVRMILMDGNFAFIDTSFRHALTQEDLDAAALGEPLYLELSTQPQIFPSDLFVGIQHLGDNAAVNIVTSGNGPTGGSALMQGTLFDITWTTPIPMVRLHLEDYGVGIAETVVDMVSGMLAYPVPMDRTGTISFTMTAASPVELSVHDLTGRPCLKLGLGPLSVGTHKMDVDVSQVPTGAYVVQVRTTHGTVNGRIVVVH